MADVNLIKKTMRISHGKLDEEIKNNIDFCLLDLERVGVNKSKEKLVNKACELYCKSEFNYEGKGEQYRIKYEKLRDALSLCGEYMEGNNV